MPDMGASGGTGNDTMPGSGGSMQGSGGSMQSAGGSMYGSGGTSMPGSGGSVTCPTIGCSPEFQRDLEIDDVWGDGNISLSVDVSQNDILLGGSLSIERSSIGLGSGIGLDVPTGERNGTPLLTFTVWGSETPGKLRLTVWWRLWQSSDAQDGDVYKLEVGNLATMLQNDVYSQEWVVNYVDEQIAACTRCLRAVPIEE